MPIEEDICSILMLQIMRVLNSKEEFKIDGGLKINIIYQELELERNLHLPFNLT